MRQRNPLEEKPSNGETPPARSSWHRFSRKPSLGNKRGEAVGGRSSSLRRSNASRTASPDDLPYNVALREDRSWHGRRATVDGDSKRTLQLRTDGDYALLAMAGASDQGLQLTTPSDSSGISSVLGTPISVCHTPQNVASGFGDVQAASPILPETLSGRSRSSDWGSPFASKTRLDVCPRSLSSPNLLAGAFTNAAESPGLQSLAISLRGPTGDWEAVLAVFDPSSLGSLLNQRIADRLGLESIRIPTEKRTSVMTPFGPALPQSFVYNIGLKEGGGVAGNPIAANIAIAPFGGNTVDIIIGLRMMRKLRNASMGGGIQSMTGSSWTEPGDMGPADFSTPRYPGDEVWLPGPSNDLARGPVRFRQEGIPVPFPGHLSCINTTDQMFSGACGGGPQSYGVWNWAEFPPVGSTGRTDGIEIDENLAAAFVGMNRM